MLIKCNKRFLGGVPFRFCFAFLFFVVVLLLFGAALVPCVLVGACAWSVVSLIASRCCVALCVVCFAFASIA